MSNFAQRLVARSAGTPLGPSIAILTPRPVTRFEPQPIAAIEQQVAAEGPVSSLQHADRSTAGPMAERRATGPDEVGTRTTKLSAAGPAPLGDADRPAVDQAWAADAAVPLLRHETAHPLPETTRHQGVPFTPAHEKQIVRAEQTVPLANAKLAVAPSERPRPPGPDDHAGTPTVMEPSRSLPAERSPPATPARTTPAADAREREGQEFPAPMISIGRIEVQFLPQAQHMPAPAPLPQRTRGFDAYARSRLGEPR
jgi:hypothetical protein